MLLPALPSGTFSALLSLLDEAGAFFSALVVCAASDELLEAVCELFSPLSLTQ